MSGRRYNVVQGFLILLAAHAVLALAAYLAWRLA